MGGQYLLSPATGPVGGWSPPCCSPPPRWILPAACRSGRRWAAWTALLIGAASAPQAAASGFDSPYTVPDAATAALGILLAVTILAAAGRTGTPGPNPELPALLERLRSKQ